MNLDQRLLALVNAIGPDIKALKTADGNLASLSTTAKANLVGAINEVYAMAQAAAGGGVSINDAAGDGNVTQTWSANKIFDELTAGLAALKAEIMGPEASAALDTFKEIQDQLAADESATAALTTAVSNRVRFDAAQALTGPQMQQARDNIGAASATAVGNTDQDLVAAYTTAKA